MKILHTADVHLHQDHPQRLDALNQVLQLAQKRKADLLLIAGDLFDDDNQANQLRPQLRSIFSDLSFPVVAIPGNHDQQALAQGSYYGKNFNALAKQPFEIFDHDQCRIVGVPYFDGSLAPLLPQLRQQTKEGVLNILLLHCTWALPNFSDQDYGGEGHGRYLPVTEQLLTGNGFDLVLAGHFHTTYIVRDLPCGSRFVYSGSPVSITSREQGRRGVNWIDNGNCELIELDTYYHQTIQRSLTGRHWQEVIKDIDKETKSHPDDICQLLIQVTGYAPGSEEDIHRALEILAETRSNTTVDHLYRSVGNLLEDPLYKRIKEQLETGEMDEKLRHEAHNMLLEAFVRQAGEDNR